MSSDHPYYSPLHRDVIATLQFTGPQLSVLRDALRASTKGWPSSDVFALDAVLGQAQIAVAMEQQNQHRKS